MGPSEIRDTCLFRAPTDRGPGGPSVHSVHSHDGSDQYPGDLELIRSADGEAIVYETSIKEGTHGGGDRSLVEDFVSVVRGRTPNRPDSKTGYLATLLAERSDLSMREGRTITFTPQDFEAITAAE